MEEFLSSLLKGIKERNRSGFWFTFIFSWCIYNWKVIVILFFEPKESFGKHSLLDAIEILNPNSKTICAFITALFISALLPWIHSGIAWYNRFVLRRKEKWVLNAEGYNGPADPERILTLYNQLAAERQKSLKSKIDFDQLKLEKENLKKEKDEAFASYFKLQMEPLVKTNEELQKNATNYSTKFQNAITEYAPYQQPIELDCKSIEILEFSEGRNSFMLPLIGSKAQTDELFNRNNIGQKNFITIQNNEIIINNSAHKVYGLKNIYNESTNIKETYFFYNGSMQKSPYDFSILIISNIHNYSILTFYGYFNTNIEVPTVYIGKATAK
jgi:hypothetical protein